MVKYRCALCVIFFFLPYAAWAQKDVLKMKTIRISAKKGVTLTFPGEILTVPPTCSDYRIIQEGKSVTISVGSRDVPDPYCTVSITEGTKRAFRTHTFILTFVPEINTEEQVFDYSTKAKLKQGVAEQKNITKNAAQAPAIKTLPLPPEEPGTSKPGQKAYTLAQAKSADSSDIDPGLKARIEKHTIERIHQFYSVCKNLGNRIRKTSTIKTGMELFNDNDTAMIETTNLTGPNKNRKILKYFNDLYNIGYQKIEMSASDIIYLSDFVKFDENRYYATAQIIQDFKGFKDGNVVAYMDKTNKTFQVIVERFTREKEGRIFDMFEVYFGNVSVTNIK